MKHKLLLVILYLNAAISYCQSEHTLGFMDNVFQSTYSNPTSIPQHSVSIGLPGISSLYGGLTFTGFTYNQIVRGDSVDVNNAIRKMAKKNYIYLGGSVDVLHLRFKLRNSFISFNIRDIASARFSYPKELISLAWKGNYQYVGSKLELNSLGFDATYYREYAVGYVRQGKNWDFAGRIKLLQGIANVQTRAKNLGLAVGEEYYDLTLTSNATLNTGGLDPSGEIDPKNLLPSFKNRGVAFDLGATYKYNDKWHFFASINNIGFISWRYNVTNYNLKGGGTFQGIDYKFLKQDSSRIDYLDSLTNKFVVNETQSAYYTWVIPQLYLRAKYNLTKTTALNAAFSFEKYKALRTSITVGVTQELGRTLDLLLTYTLQYRNLDNIGMGIMLKPGPFQIYFVSDYLIRKYSFDTDPAMFVPKRAKTFNLRFGINLVFGRIKNVEKQTGPLN